MQADDPAAAVAWDAAPNPNLDPLTSSTALNNAQLVAEADAALNNDDLHSSLPTLHKVTPLIFSETLSRRVGHNIWLKLDALQPSGSFKIRGVGASTIAAYKKYGSSAHIVSSSGGNAGLAAATAVKILNEHQAQRGVSEKLACTIFVPSSTEDAVIATLRKLGAEVHISGDSWSEADVAARQLVDDTDGAVYIHPFEGEELVKGHATISHEIYDQFAAAHRDDSTAQPDIIIATVGGGGFIRGILHGISERAPASADITPPLVVATQDFGADSFAQSMNQYFADPSQPVESQHVALQAITSKATSMGAKLCSKNSLIAARSYCESGSSLSTANQSDDHAESQKLWATAVMSDSLSASACWQFMRDHEYMVELSCGAALAPIYHHERLLPPILAQLPSSSSNSKNNIVVVVCGGSKVSQEMLDDYEKEFGDMQGRGEAQVDGKDV